MKQSRRGGAVAAAASTPSVQHEAAEPGTVPMVRRIRVRHSVLLLAKHAVSGHRRSPRFWRGVRPLDRYEVVIVGQMTGTTAIMPLCPLYASRCNELLFAVIDQLKCCHPGSTRAI